MHILYVTYEVAPFFQTGGLGDVSRDLPFALSEIGVKTTLILPKFQFIKLPNKVDLIGQFDLIFDRKKEIIKIYKMPSRKHVNLYLLSHPMLLDPINKGDQVVNFVLFSKAIAFMLLSNKENIFGDFDLVHLNDWFAGATPYYLKVFGRGTPYPPSIITIHNLMYQGYIDKDKKIDIFNNKKDKEKFKSLLEIGLTQADFITTVSPTYAQEICHSKIGRNLKSLLYQRRKRVEGILNGINYVEWDSTKDKYLDYHFSVQNIEEGKIKNKLALQKILQLPLNQDIPLVSFIGRLAIGQKGIELICKMLEELLPERGFQFVLLGTGNNLWAKKISLLVGKYPKNVVFINKFDQSCAHKIYASSDIILIPSKYEPCGLVQMIAMRYGTLPLVRKTGGLADTVVDGKNGFVFESYSPTALTRTLRLALKLFKENPEKIAKMRENAMKEDFSWDKSAKEYKKLYQKVASQGRTLRG